MVLVMATALNEYLAVAGTIKLAEYDSRATTGCSTAC